MYSSFIRNIKVITNINSSILRNLKRSVVVGTEVNDGESKQNLDPSLETISNLEKDKSDLKSKLEDLEDKYKRSLAETENVRQRLQRQITDAKIFGIQAFCKDLLEVADILNKATDSVPIDKLSDNQPLADLFSGLQMTNTQLTKVFNKHGLEIISPPIGEKFNPNIHEALFQQPLSESTNHTPGMIAAVTKPGYKLHDRTIRPALVGVFQ